MKEFGEAAGIVLLVLTGFFILKHEEILDRFGFTTSVCECPVEGPSETPGEGVPPKDHFER